MNTTAWSTILWQQFGAAIDMLENAVTACPDDLWDDDAQPPEFWYLVYHTLFFLDLYLSGSVAGFTPPDPFTLSGRPDENRSRGLMRGAIRPRRAPERGGVRWRPRRTSDTLTSMVSIRWIGTSHHSRTQETECRYRK